MGIRKGFTLAEVLITLVIIGVIAALTIPALMNKTNEQETVVAVKKAYSVISQAYQRVIAENGEIIPSSLGENGTDATKTLGKMFAKQLNTQKVCGISSGGDCFADKYTYFDGSVVPDFNNDNFWYKLRLNDGMSLGFVKLNNTYEIRGNSEPLNYVIVYVIVDVNGDKAPNIVGKDVFAFYITKFGVIPYGSSDDTVEPISTCRTVGWGCTAWVTTKGNVDYWHKEVSW